MFWMWILVILVGGGIAAFYIMRMLKGKIRINLYQTSFAYGEPITGTITILAKKPIQSKRLVLSLVGDETRYYRDKDKDSATKDTRDFPQ